MPGIANCRAGSGIATGKIKRFSAFFLKIQVFNMNKIYGMPVL